MKQLLIASILLLSLSALAENKPVKPTGSGSEDDPFLISRIEHLVWMGENIRDFRDKCFKMTADIDASETKSWHDSRGFLPIGFLKERSPDYSSVSFCGVFDGGGHVISNLYIDRKNQCAALFSGIGSPLSKEDLTANVLDNLSKRSENRATVKDLALINCSFTGRNLAAGLCGRIESSLISRVYISGKLKSSRLAAGIAEISNNSCLDECEIDLKFENRVCAAACFVSSARDTVLKNCLSKGSFQYSEDNTADRTNIMDYWSPRYRIDVRPKNLGCYPITIAGKSSPVFCNCLVLNSIQGGKRKSNLHCFSKPEYLQNSFYSTDNLQSDPKGRTLGGLPNRKLMEKGTYVGWDFDSVWEIEDGISFPKLRKIEKMLKR